MITDFLEDAEKVEGFCDSCGEPMELFEHVDNLHFCESCMGDVYGGMMDAQEEDEKGGITTNRAHSYKKTKR